jgi:hypothetical protein
VLVELFNKLCGKVSELSSDQIKLLPSLSYHIETHITRILKTDELVITFPNGTTGNITAKMAKLSTLIPLIPEEYFVTTAKLMRINSYTVKYFDNNKSIKVGCKTIKVGDLYSYFDSILQSWDDLDEQLKNT